MDLMWHTEAVKRGEARRLLKPSRPVPATVVAMVVALLLLLLLALVVVTEMASRVKQWPRPSSR